MFNDEEKYEICKYFDDINIRYFNIPTVDEMREVHQLLTNGDKEAYIIDKDNYLEKEMYWHTVHNIYSENRFVMPHSVNLSRQATSDEIVKYYVAPEDVRMVEDILKMERELYNNRLK